VKGARRKGKQGDSQRDMSREWHMSKEGSSLVNEQVNVLGFTLFDTISPICLLVSNSAWGFSSVPSAVGVPQLDL